MFIITNRRLNEKESGLNVLDDVPNEKGPNELRVLKATPSRRTWKLIPIPDKLPQSWVDEIKTKTRLDLARLAEDKPLYGSRWVADQVFAAGKHVVFFVHGYNTNVEDALNRSRQIEKDFKVQVVLFSWPANGGGLRGTASYLSDKNDARASDTALFRALKVAGEHLMAVRGEAVHGVIDDLAAMHPGDPAKRERLIAATVARQCPMTINLLAHSMGNYLLKQVYKTSLSAALPLLFDNVLLAAADANNLDHAAWVNRIDFRNRLFICINEDDYALGFSRLKGGDLQLDRLGHYSRRLDADRATYVDFTGARHVGKAHTYFGGDPLDNAEVRAFFASAFAGGRPELAIPYDASRNLHRLAGLTAWSGVPDYEPGPPPDRPSTRARRD